MRSVLLDITGGVLNGRLALEWTFSTGIFNPSTIEESATDFINRLKQIIQHCTSPQAEGFTPSDFPLTGLDQKELDKLLGKIKH
jgi:non-ribosomal peptide synthase protein (TIGR01720 family)